MGTGQMTWLPRWRFARTATILVLGSLPVLGAAAKPAAGRSAEQSAAGEHAAPAKETGDLWEVTSQMLMEGMAVPAQKLKVCAPKDWKEPPGAADERRKCKNSDVKQDGAKVTWKTVCAGPPEM